MYNRREDADFIADIEDSSQNREEIVEKMIA